MADRTLRLDRWLWFTRFYKTRSAASAAVQGGHIRHNGERARSSTKVAIGDHIRLVRNQLTYDLTVEDIPSRRGPAPEAQACYSESEASIAAREGHLADLRSDRLQMPTTPGRPDKHTRRRLRERNRGKD
ncbi:MAG: RNA-binding S4 domain-containing protein [Gammaproteobacteria bacterium]|nr:RNA-binding S4 domain-containing protein [Gammaproteobacteria bacterium]MDH3777759.1 RNA-binding S4 domain-containing protein [Gammaproteobacteria bacterium]MDH3812051.1 RNA-binding S4 domain-containing protein [Gammaproteobacteria bacterium]